MRSVLIALLFALGCGGCRAGVYFARGSPEPLRAWEARVDPDRRRDCLVILIPGLFDTPDQLFDQGFVADALRASDLCDLVAVDAHVGYYADGRIADRLSNDILIVAESRGYEEIWVVGISMGALGGLILARDHPGEIRGVIALSPWLGDEDLVGTVLEAGGLSRWEPPEITERTTPLRAETIRTLTWLATYTHEGSESLPELTLGVASRDHYRGMGEVVAEAVAEARRYRVEGEHDWTSWRELFAQVLRDPPWDRHR